MTQSLPSYLPSEMTKNLDAAYERGFRFGRAAGLEAACDVLRNMPHDAKLVTLIETLTREKYK
jgi:hypothetical protein